VAFGALSAPNATLGASSAPNATLGASNATNATLGRIAGPADLALASPVARLKLPGEPGPVRFPA